MLTDLYTIVYQNWNYCGIAVLCLKPHPANFWIQYNLWKFWFLKVSDLKKRWEARSPSNPEIHKLWIERENMARTREFLTHFNLRKLHIPNFSNLTGGMLHRYLNCNHLVFFLLKLIFPRVFVFQDAFMVRLDFHIWELSWLGGY